MSNVGKRLRKLRKEKGLTQTEATGGEYSKEYVSQVELGKTRPSRKAVKLFAKYLDVDESYFETGVDISGHERFENLMANGEVLIEQREYSEAVRVLEEARAIGEKAESDDFMWRAEVGRAWALLMSGRQREALVILGDARAYYEDKHADSMELALVLFRSACGREAVRGPETRAVASGGVHEDPEPWRHPVGRASNQDTAAYGRHPRASPRSRSRPGDGGSRPGDRQAPW